MWMTRNNSAALLMCSLALASLVGCQGFKSRVFTPEEIKAYHAAKKDGKKPVRETPPAPTPEVDQTRSGEPAPVLDKTGGKPEPNQTTLTRLLEVKPTQPVSPFVDTSGATAKILVEGVPAKSVREFNAQLLLSQDPEAAKLVKGANFEVTGSVETGDLKINVRALVIAREAHSELSVMDSPLSFVADDANTLPMANVKVRSLTDTTNTFSAAEPDVVLNAFCADSICQLIQLRMDFMISSSGKPGGVTAIFQLQQSAGKIVDIKSNLDPVKSYDEALLELEAPVAATEEPKPSTPVKPDAPAAKKPVASINPTVSEKVGWKVAAPAAATQPAAPVKPDAPVAKKPAASINPTVSEKVGWKVAAPAAATQPAAPVKPDAPAAKKPAASINPTVSEKVGWKVPVVTPKPATNPAPSAKTSPQFALSSTPAVGSTLGKPAAPAPYRVSTARAATPGDVGPSLKAVPPSSLPRQPINPTVSEKVGWTVTSSPATSPKPQAAASSPAAAPSAKPTKFAAGTALGQPPTVPVGRPFRLPPSSASVPGNAGHSGVPLNVGMPASATPAPSGSPSGSAPAAPAVPEAPIAPPVPDL